MCWLLLNKLQCAEINGKEWREREGEMGRKEWTSRGEREGEKESIETVLSSLP